MSGAIFVQLTVSIVDPPGADVYPIASFTWFVVPARIPDESKRAVLTDFLKWKNRMAEYNRGNLPEGLTSQKEEVNEFLLETAGD